jgi:hypothetical protein
MAPGATPISVTVCAYLGSNSDTESAWPLSSQPRALTGGLDRLAQDLFWLPPADAQPQACTAMGGPQTSYLVGVRYRNGSLWVAAADEPNHCAGASNGRFTSQADLGGALTLAHRSGAWPGMEATAQKTPACWRGAPGRRGQERVLVPDTPVAVLICREPTNAGNPFVRTRVREQRVLSDLQRRLNAYPTRASGHSCSQADPDRDPLGYRLVFEYAEGPPLALRYIAGCRPMLDNGGLEADGDETLASGFDDILDAGRAQA